MTGGALLVWHCLLGSSAERGRHSTAVSAAPERAAAVAGRLSPAVPSRDPPLAAPHGKQRLFNLAPGLFVCVNVKHVLFERNELRDNRGPGISIGCGDTDNLFRENTIVGNGRTGVLFRDDGEPKGAHRNVLERNTILDNGLAEKCDQPHGCVTILGIHHGLVFRENTLGNTQAGGPVGIGILGGHDPKELTIEGNHFLNLQAETAPVADVKPK